jgi:hypothetical protein
MNASDELIELYRDWQHALARYGDTHYTADLFFELSKLIEADPFLDNEGFEAALERLHRVAFTDPLPVRLTLGEIADPRE